MNHRRLLLTALILSMKVVAINALFCDLPLIGWLFRLLFPFWCGENVTESSPSGVPSGSPSVPPTTAPTEDPLNQDLGPVTYPFLQLVSPLTKSFGPTTADVCIEKVNGDFEVLIFKINDFEVTPEINERTACVLGYSFVDGANSIDASDGLLELSETVQAGSSSIEIILLDEAGDPFLKETNVKARLSDDQLVLSVRTTCTYGVEQNLGNGL